MVKNLPVSAGDTGDMGLILGLGGSSGQPTPVFLPGVFHGQRSLVGYSPWGHKESDTTERVTHTCEIYKELIQLNRENGERK